MMRAWLGAALAIACVTAPLAGAQAQTRTAETSEPDYCQPNRNGPRTQGAKHARKPTVQCNLVRNDSRGDWRDRMPQADRYRDRYERAVAFNNPLRRDQ